MRRGLALILVVGTLGVLAVLGTGFAILSGMERRAATQRVQGTRALLLARSGIEDARARLDAGQDPSYGGEDWDNSTGLNGLELAAEVIRPGILDRDACPVRHALRPSFFARDVNSLGADLLPAPRKIQVEGRERGYSGCFSSGTWAIRATPAGGFHVNGGNPAVTTSPATTATSDFNVTLRRMLGLLAEALDREDGTNDGLPVDQTDGEKLITLRPVKGWTSFDQVRSIALGGAQAKLDALKEYLVLEAWTDKKVIAPCIDRRSGLNVVSLLNAPNGGFRSSATLRIGNWANGMSLGGLTRMCPDLERVPKQRILDPYMIDPWLFPGGPVCGRASVDLAWARTRRPALIALLGNLKGFYWREYCGETGLPLDALRALDCCGALFPVELALSWTAASDDCRTVADALLASTSELRTWEQFNAFCDALPLTGASDLGQAKKDLLKANFNPNTDANKFNATESVRRMLDKSDLLVPSTELSLVPGSAWRLSVCGRVPGKAARSLSAETRPDRVFRLTAQSELVAEDLGHTDLLGDEAGFRSHLDSPYITPSAGAGRTFGHSLPGAPASGLSLQTYPEVPAMWSSGTYRSPPVWDGRLSLATVETSDGEYSGAGLMKFLARWDDGWDADFGNGNRAVLAPDVTQGAAGDAIWPAPDINQDPYYQTVSNLFPDGAFLEHYMIDMSNGWEQGSIPGYAALDNMAPSQGTISYWVKPSTDTTKHTGLALNTYRCHFNNTRTLAQMTQWSPPTANRMAETTACFFLVAGGIRGSSYWNGQTGRAFSSLWENYFFWRSDADARDEQALSTPERDVRSRWYLVTHFWDMVTPRSVDATSRSARVFVDRGMDASDRNSNWSYADEFNNAIRPSGSPVDFTMQSGSTAIFHLGPRSQGNPEYNYGAGKSPDATMDELAIYDLGLGLEDGSALDGILNSANLARSRYEDGRYYKGDDGAWFSAPVDLGDVHLRTLSWTQIVPRGLKGLPLPIPAGTPVEDYDNPNAPTGAPDGKDGRVLLELSALPGLRTDSRGEILARRVKAPFRLHAVFQPRLADPLGKAILDPLSLDDVTVTYRPVDAPAMAAWREGE